MMKSNSTARCFVVILIAAGVLCALNSPSYAQSGRKPQEAPPSSPDETRPRKVTDSDSGGEKKPSRPLSDNTPVTIDENGTIKMDTALVTIPVTVVDHVGKFIPNLKKRDFRLYEDGVEQEIEAFESVETPFHVALVLDTSGSTRFKLEDIQKAAFAFVQELKRDDQVMVVSFDSRVRFHCDFTNNYDKLRRAIYETRTGGSTKLYEAVDMVIDRMHGIQGRKAIVLFTDGVDTASRHASYKSTSDKVEESGILVYPVRYDTEMDNPQGGVYGPIGPSNPWPWPMPFPRGRRWPVAPIINHQFPQWPGRWPRGGGGGMGDYRLAARYLQELADRSGGRLYNANNLTNVSSAFSLIAEELRQQYSLSYYPTNAKKDGTYRRVQVSVRKTGMIVRSRDGYRAALDQQAKDGGSVDTGRPELKRKQMAAQ
ncbi:MAG: VWA domain-containing protein [Blastocatellia bacterium]|nr:VWA domain-containing protein [Blastocatellia bacterium]